MSNFGEMAPQWLQKKLQTFKYERIYHFKEVLLLAILTRNKSSNFPLSSCQYVSTIPEKTAFYRPFKNGHFVRVSTEKMMDHQYRENGARSIFKL